MLVIVFILYIISVPHTLEGVEGPLALQAAAAAAAAAGLLLWYIPKIEVCFIEFLPGQ